VQIAPYDYGDSNINGACCRKRKLKQWSMQTWNGGDHRPCDSVTNIHPSHKREVGNSLRHGHLPKTYHQNGIVYRSPEFEKAEKKSSKVELSFTNVPTGLKTSDKAVKGFMISDAAGQWFPAEAKISGNKIHRME
jgi:sialate O-acetylesterase